MREGTNAPGQLRANQISHHGTTPVQCHGRQTFASRPPAGASSGEWLWQWQRAGEVVVHTADLGSQWATTTWAADGPPKVTLHYRLTSVQRNAAIAHELHHVAIGGVCRSHCTKNEQIVRRETARWLLPDVAGLGDDLTRKSIVRASHDRGLPSHLVWQRLGQLTKAEQRVLDEIMGRDARVRGVA